MRGMTLWDSATTEMRRTIARAPSAMPTTSPRRVPSLGLGRPVARAVLLELREVPFVLRVSAIPFPGDQKTYCHMMTAVPTTAVYAAKTYNDRLLRYVRSPAIAR